MPEPESEDEEDQEEEEEEDSSAEEEDQGEEEEEPEPPAPPAKRSSRGGTKRTSGGGSGGSTKKSTPASRKTRGETPQPTTSSAAKKRRSANDAGSGDAHFDKAAHSELLNELKKQPTADYFLRPVKAKDAPGYYQIVREPMDLSTMQRKLNGGGYSSNAEFAADAGLIFSNCLMYNDSKAQISRSVQQGSRVILWHSSYSKESMES